MKLKVKPKTPANAPAFRPEARDGRGARARRIAWKITKWGFVVTLALGAIGAATVAIMLWVYGSDPSLHSLNALRDYKPKQVTRIYSADGKLIGEIFDERRTFVPLARIAPIMVQAIIDSEDANFREHRGVDFTGMMRAMWVNVRHGETRQGASTITQQVVKTFLLTPERTFKRKVQEVILARRIEISFTKDEILELYLNQIYFGHGRYGIEEAAHFYFGKRAAELNVGEAAMLAGIVQSPERLSPKRHPEAAKGRQTYVLRQMAIHGHISEDEARRWIDAPIEVVKDADPYLDIAPELVEVVRKELAARYGDKAVPTLGLTVRTTLDVDVQIAARKAVENGLRAIDKRHGYHGAIEKLAAADVDKRLAELKDDLDGKPPGGGDSYDAIVTAVDDTAGELTVDLGGWQGAVILGGDADDRYNAEQKKPSERFAPNDVVVVRLAPELGKPKTPGVKAALSLELGPQAAMVVIDPATRHVLALVGGYAYKAGQFDRATRAKRQPGSSFKPFIYAAALDSHKFTPASIVNDAPEVYDLWKPKNYERKFVGPVRLRTALAESINTVAIRVLHDVGTAPVIGLAHAMGISEELPDNLSLALGSGVVTPLELVNAYATFPAGGVYAPPVFITAVGDQAASPAPPAQALKPEVAYVITNMLMSVVKEGTAIEARGMKRVIAGKTGTSNSGRDAWFVGFSPDLVAGVWVGFDDMREIGRGEAGAKAALPIWIDLMSGALKTRGQKTFRQPTAVVTARIDKKTGKLASPGEPESETLEEVFLDGTVPTEIAPGPGEVDPSEFVTQQGDDGDVAAPAPTPAPAPPLSPKKKAPAVQPPAGTP